MILSLLSFCKIQVKYRQDIKMTTFKPGYSGNPKGRPKGALNKRAQLIKHLETHAEELINKAIGMALSGDSIALRLCIERLLPKAVEKQAKVIIPDLNTNETSKILSELLKSLANQELSISEFKNLIEVLHKYNNEIGNSNSEKLELNTTDPIEAAKIYQQMIQSR